MAQQARTTAADQNIVKAEPVVKDERSIGDLFSELAGETSSLIRQEVALAQVEITDKATRAGKNVGYLVVGGAIAYAALLTLLAALVIGLADLLDISAWIPALIVGLIVGGVAFWMISSALDALKNMNFTPKQTVESLKEDAEWLKDQVS